MPVFSRSTPCASEKTPVRRRSRRAAEEVVQWWSVSSRAPPRGSLLLRAVGAREEAREKGAPTCARGSSELAVGSPCSIRQRPLLRRTSREWRRLGKEMSRAGGGEGARICSHPRRHLADQRRRAGRSFTVVEGGGGAGKLSLPTWTGRRVKRAPSSAWISPPRISTFVVVAEPPPPRAPSTAFACSSSPPLSCSRLREARQGCEMEEARQGRERGQRRLAAAKTEELRRRRSRRRHAGGRERETTTR